MVTRALIDDLLGQKSLALAGVSRSGRGFGAMARRELAARGWTLYLIHPEAESIEGEPCFKSLREVADRVGGLLLVTAPAVTEALVREAAECGIRRIWMQQGAESAEAVGFCERAGIPVVHGECILMFAEPPAWIHRAHRWLRGKFGKLPA